MASCCVTFNIFLEGERGHQCNIQRVQTFGPAPQQRMRELSVL